MINYDLPWCTYRSEHPSGFYYQGKGKTDKVLNNKYKGSGIKFKLSLKMEEYSWDTWNTFILETFATEQEAYDAEALLVPIEALRDPYCMNMTAGGQKGKYQTHGTLYKKDMSLIKQQNRELKKAAAKLREEKLKQKISAMNKKMKELK